jgi:putative membrane protein
MMPGFGCFGNYGSYGWIGMLISLVITIVVVVGIIWLVVWLARKGISGNQGHSMAPKISPREILQTRYARGEITREQYQQMLEDLG